MPKDYYKILGVDKNASQDEIKKAFRKMAHQHHPDKKGGDEAKFKEVNEAYQVLGNLQKRAQYDKFGSSFEHAQAGGGFSGFEGFRDFSGFTNGFDINFDDLNDIFSGIGDVFGFGGGNRKARARKGGDIQIDITIEFSEAVFGTEKEISFKKKVVCDKCAGGGAEPGSKMEICKTCGGLGRVMRAQRTILGNIQTQTACPDCGGEGKNYSQKCSKCGGFGVIQDITKIKVKIPAGVDNNETIRLSGYGEAGLKGAPAGDLFIRIKVNQDSRFRREGYDIFYQVEISIKQAVLGDKIEIPTVDGDIKLKIPEGTQSGKVFRLSGRGVPRLRGRGRGDQLVEVIVKIPTSLTREQKRKLEELGI